VPTAICPSERGSGAAGTSPRRTTFSRNELPLFPRWDAARLDALEARAIAWLEPAATE